MHKILDFFLNKADLELLAFILVCFFDLTTAMHAALHGLIYKNIIEENYNFSAFL
jgi:hypothetical protein